MGVLRSSGGFTGARRRAFWLLIAATLVAAAGWILSASAAHSATVCRPPVFHGEPYEEEVFATRARMYAEFEAGGSVSHPCPVDATAEYSTSLSGPWTFLDTEHSEGTASIEVARAGTLGSPLGFERGSRYIRHLTPATSYFVRFRATSSEGEGTETFGLKTNPVSKPEIATVAGGRDTTFAFITGEGGLTQTSAHFTADIEGNGATTEYHFEYAEAPSGPWKPFTSGGTGTISLAEDFIEPDAELTGLTPQTTYYVRVKASSEKGSVEQAKYTGGGNNEVSAFTTRPARPLVFLTSVRNVTGVTSHVLSAVVPNGRETTWRFETAQSPSGPWTPAPGTGGTISQARAEALGESVGEFVGGDLSGLSPATHYYVRLFAQNSAGEGEACHDERAVQVCEAVASAGFVTAGPPTASTFTTHALHGESLRLLAAVNPESALTSAEQSVTLGGSPTGGTFTLGYNGHTTAPLPYNASDQAVDEALDKLPGLSALASGPPGGPYAVYFQGMAGGKNQPLLEGDGSGLTPSGSVTVQTTQVGGIGYDTHYHFEYVTQEQFEQSGFSGAATTPEVDLGSGNTTQVVGQDAPGLTAGGTYHYRVVASSTAPGNPVVDGGERTLIVPAQAPASPGGSSCPNEAFRTGAASRLPDCRAYEQLTPINKEGAEEMFTYGAGLPRGALASQDGNHVVYEDLHSVDWFPESAQGPYFFSREAEPLPGADGWQVTPTSRQPETGLATLTPQLYAAADFSKVALKAEYETSPGSPSPEVRFEVGAPGGPYTTVASVPRADVGETGAGGPGTIEAAGWVAGTPDFSKLILKFPDRELLGLPTGTEHGDDLYEYARGALRQVNVDSEGQTIGSCGAQIPSGDEGVTSVNRFRTSPSTISADGSHVFFEAVPGSNCSAARHIYVREDADRTLDIGAGTFLGASPDGGELLLERGTGATREVVLYDLHTDTSTALFTLPTSASDSQMHVSIGLGAIYFALRTQMAGTEAPATPAGNSSVDNLYRYDIRSRTLAFVAQTTSAQNVQPTSDGRYYYFQAIDVGGVPGSATSLPGQQQVYRYDSATALVQCVSCASSFDPEPRLSSYFGTTTETGRTIAANLAPEPTLVSNDGSYAFYYTASALLPEDVDGEIQPRQEAGEFSNLTYSPSTDVYEWRRTGVDGCAHVQGCLALLTTGHGGYLNLLIGSAQEGRDVFIATRSQLLARDKDTSMNIFDARIDGGQPEPPLGPVPCEGDACSTPASAPNDTTPASFTFTGAGNLLAPAPSTPNTVKPKPKSKSKLGCKSRGKHKCKAKRKARRSRAHRASRRGGR